jgi:hypothetical protein
MAHGPASRRPCGRSWSHCDPHVFAGRPRASGGVPHGPGPYTTNKQSHRPMLEPPPASAALSQPDEGGGPFSSRDHWRPASCLGSTRLGLGRVARRATHRRGRWSMPAALAVLLVHSGPTCEAAVVISSTSLDFRPAQVREEAHHARFR